MVQFLRVRTYLLLSACLIGVVGAWYIFRDTETLPKGVEVGEVTRGIVEEMVNETGFVQGVRSVNLAFQTSGQIMHIQVAEGDMVAEGDVLATLNDERAKSDVASAEARLRAEEIRLDEMLTGADVSSRAIYERAVETARIALENAKKNLDEVTVQQELLVENAERVVRSGSLQAELLSEKRENTDYVYTPPTVSGTYTGNDGVYTISLYSSGAPSGSSFRYSGSESGIAEVSTIASVPLGSLGLRVQFPDNFAPSTEWEIRIPNTKSSTYLTNLNTYNATRKARDVALAVAEGTVRSAEASLAQAEAQLSQASGAAREERISAQRALIEQMKALVTQARALYQNTVITAPFSGVVVTVHAEPGESVSAGVPLIDLISEESFEVGVNLSEIDIAEINIGDTAVVTLDAFEDIKLDATVSEIAPRVSVVNGVRVIPIVLVLTTDDTRIKDGFTAQIDIHSAIREDVIAIPSRAVYEDAEGKFVWVIKEDNSLERVAVRTGLRGTNGFTEITEGLREGERIITFATTEALALLKKS